MIENKRPSSRKHRKKLSMRDKAHLTWLMDKVNDVFVAAYALFTGDKWLAALKGTATITTIATLFALSALLVLMWSIIGLFKGKLEEDHESK